MKYAARVKFSPEAYFLGGDMNASNAFSEKLIRQGYTGVKQATNGDEIVVFNSNDIKDVSPVTYDDEENVIPLSERFNSEKKDIRYKVSAGDKAVSGQKNRAIPQLRL